MPLELPNWSEPSVTGLSNVMVTAPLVDWLSTAGWPTLLGGGPIQFAAVLQLPLLAVQWLGPAR